MYTASGQSLAAAAARIAGLEAEWSAVSHSRHVCRITRSWHLHSPLPAPGLTAGVGGAAKILSWQEAPQAIWSHSFFEDLRLDSTAFTMNEYICMFVLFSFICIHHQAAAARIVALEAELSAVSHSTHVCFVTQLNPPNKGMLFCSGFPDC